MAHNLIVGLAWQSLTSSNLGVSALGLSQLEIVRAAAARAGCNVEFIEFCHSEVRPQDVASLGVLLADPLSPKSMLLGRTRVSAQLRQCDVILDIGEGDSFSDIYGPKRFLLLAFLKWRVVREGIPLVLSPQTIGPFNASWVKAVARQVLTPAHRVFPRDHLSLEYLQQNGLDGNATEVIDVAFRLPFERRTPPTDGRVHVGLNVSGLLFNGGYTGNNQFSLTVDYRQLVEAIGEQMQRQQGVVLHLIGHVNSHDFAVEDDYRVCAQLAAAWPGSVLAPRFDTPSQAKSYISGLHFFAGARMHACIGAFSSGVPVVPMAYSRKFNGLFQSLGYHALADMKRQTTIEATDAVLQGFAARDTLSREVAAGNVLAQRKLQVYEDYLVELFRGLGRAAA